MQSMATDATNAVGYANTIETNPITKTIIKTNG